MTSITAEPRVVRVERLSPERFAPFGTAIGVFGDRVPDVVGPNWQGWYPLAEASSVTPVRFGVVLTRPPAGPMTVMEVHQQRTECAFALDAPFVLAVTATSADGRSPDPDLVRAFAVFPGEGAVLPPGTWHAAGSPLGSEPVRYLFSLPAPAPNEVDSGWVRFSGDVELTVDGSGL